MDTLEPKHSITADVDRGEVHFMIGGYWERDTMEAFLIDLDKAAFPVLKTGKPIRVLGNMESFATQNRDTAVAIQNQLHNAVEHGLQKVAIYNVSALVKSQYRRLSTGIDVAFFDNRFDAIAWLRSED